MAQRAVKKGMVSFNRGFTSDAGPLTFPEGFSLDEQNYDIQIDGTRRRRKGLQQDTGDVTIAVDRDSDENSRSFKWPAAGDDTSVNLTVLQLGSEVRFVNDPDDGTVGTQKAFSIDLLGYKTAGSTDAQVRAQWVDMAVTRGRLVIVGEYISPIFVEYDPVGDSISVTAIDIRERDLYGIEDGTPNALQPTVLTSFHQYNLVNQGWMPASITQYQSDTGFYPAKNQVFHRAFRRQNVTGIADIDGTKEFSSDKLIAELFQDAPAPHGHFKIDPFNTTFGATGAATLLMSSTVTVNNLGGGNFSFTFTTDTAHGLLALDTFFIIGSPTQMSYVSTLDGTVKSFGFTGGPVTVGSVVDADTFTTQTIAGLPSDFNTPTLVTPFIIVPEDEVFANLTGTVTNRRPSTCAFFAGRIWYSGVNSGKQTSKIFFSQVIEDEAQYGKCFQVADPTDENIADLVATDGGVINIPEMGVCFRLLPYDAGLLVFAYNGIWFIGPGAAGYFTADSYSVRKISEVGVDGPASVVVAETIPFYWGRNSIYRIAKDTNTGFLVSMNMSIQRIDSFFNAIPTLAKKRVQTAYDPLLKKIYWLYEGAPFSDDVLSGFSRILIYDLKYDAFIKSTIPLQDFATPGTDVEVCVSVFSCRTPNPKNPGSTIKFVYQNSAETFFGVMTSDLVTDFEDNGNGFEQEAFMITGFDTGGDPSTRKQALYITVMSVKTETGYTLVGSDLVPVGESSTIMQTRFDWDNHINSGKWGPDQEVYRHPRLYVPVDEDDTFDNGALLVITRNKVRGRGRSLNIKFTAGEGKQSHIAGWTTNYRMLSEE